MSVIRLAAILTMAVLISPALSAQWPAFQKPGVPRTPDGKVRLDAATPRTADGKPDLSGVWETVRTGTGQAIVGKDVPPLQRTSQFWNIGAGLDGDLPLQPWARELRATRVARNSQDNPDAHCLPIGLTQLHNHPQPRKIIQTPSLIVILYEANDGIRQIFLDGRLAAGQRSAAVVVRLLGWLMGGRHARCPDDRLQGRRMARRQRRAADRRGKGH